MIIGVAIYEIVGHEAYNRVYVYDSTGEKRQYTSVLALPAIARDILDSPSRVEEKLLKDGKVRCRVYIR